MVEARRQLVPAVIRSDFKAPHTMQGNKDTNEIGESIFEPQWRNNVP